MKPFLVLLIVNIFILVIGFFMDMAASILILTPIFLPIAQSIGMHPVQFGIMLLLKPGDWLDPSSCRDCAVCRLRDSKMHAGEYRQGDLDVYSGSYFSPLAGYLFPSSDYDAAQDLHAMTPA